MLNNGNISSGDVIEESKDVSVFLEYTDNTYVVRGASGTILMVKSMTDAEQDEMIRILYPNGIVDAQGQDIPRIENAEGTSIYVSAVNKDGSLDDITSVTGVVDSEIILSPSGNKFAVGCGSERMMPKDDIIIFDLEKNTQTKVSELNVLGADDEIIYTNRVCWIDDNTLLVVVKKK